MVINHQNPRVNDFLLGLPSLRAGTSSLGRYERIRTSGLGVMSASLCLTELHSIVADEEGVEPTLLSHQIRTLADILIVHLTDCTTLFSI